VRLRLTISAALAAILLAAPSAAQGRGETSVLAKIPVPGFPASAYPHPDGPIYVGTYTNPGGDSMRSRVLEYDRDGTLMRSWAVPDQNLAAEHGIQVATSDPRRRLVLLDRTPARALLLDRHSGDFDRFATFADLRPCPGGQAQSDCSPTQRDLPPMANYAAWAPDGGLYVTDFQQGVVWRVPPSGGAAQVWLADRRLDGQEFGTTGIALAADRRSFLLAQGSSAGLGGGAAATGKLYSVPIQPDGKPGALRQLWESGPAELPDGFGIARSGRVYIALAGANEIAVLGADGRQQERFASPDFDSPSSAKFFGTRLAVPNQSFVTGSRDRQTLMSVETGEPGLPEFIPAGPDETPPVITDVSFSRKLFRAASAVRRRRVGRGTRIRFRLSEAAAVHFRIERRRRGRWRYVRAFRRRGKAGRNAVRFSGRVRARRRVRRLRAGRYRIKLRAKDAAGNRSQQVIRRFRVLR
jgi:sugar lactone lactonase YvrE